MKTLFSRFSRTVLSLSLIPIFVACGGGGGGTTTPPPVVPPPVVPPPVVDTTAPTLVGASLANGAVGVSVTLPSITYTFDEGITCKGQVTLVATTPAIGTTTCSGKTLVFAPTAQLLYATSYTITLPKGAVADVAGNLLASSKTIGFTTEKLAGAGTRLIVANSQGNFSGLGMDGGATIIDSLTETVTGLVVFPKVPGTFGADHVDADSGTGRVALGSDMGAYVIHLMTTDGTVLPSLPIDTADPNSHHGVRGLAHSDSERCAVFGENGGQATYYFRSVMRCWERDGTAVVFTSVVDFAAEKTQLVTKFLYAPQQKKYYVVAGAESSYGVLQFSLYGGYRPGFGPGSGSVREIDPVTHTVTRQFTVGQAPFDAVIRGNHLLVVNAYDKSLSDVDLLTGTVTTADLRANFANELENPVSITTDGTYEYVSDYLTAVRVLRGGSEVARIEVGGEAGRMAVVGDKLWVTAYRGDFRLNVADHLVSGLYIINRGTRLLEKTLTRTGDSPHEVTTY